MSILSDFGLPALYAVFLWWSSTGIMIYLDLRPPRTFRWSMLGATCLAAASLYGLVATRQDMSVFAAYVAFSCALFVWGWQLLGFYMGFVTGPRPVACRAGVTGWQRFVQALLACLYHELAVIVGAIVVAWITWDAPNRIGLWTYALLWTAHQSAKVNVFLGVRNLNESFIPDHLAFLRSFFTVKPMNGLFPVSVTVGTIVAIALGQKAIAADAVPFAVAGNTLLAALASLAVIEHWFLVLPLPAEALWTWSVGARSAPAASPFCEDGRARFDKSPADAPSWRVQDFGMGERSLSAAAVSIVSGRQK